MEPLPHLSSLSLLCRETFCQRPPSFLDYLHSILQKYPDGGQILKVRPPGNPPVWDLLPSGAELLQAVGLVPVQHQPQDLGAQLGERVDALLRAWGVQAARY